MHFYTENQRLAHPQACLIPKPILTSVFNDELSETYVNLMSTPWTVLLPLITDLRNHYEDGHDSYKDICYWYCASLGHPSASDEELLHLAEKLHIPAPCLLTTAAITGRQKIIDGLVATHEPDELSKFMIDDEYEAFRMMAYGGHLAIMERLMALAPEDVQDMIESEDFGAFREAAGRGHLPVMEMLMALAPLEVQSMVQIGNYYAFRVAAEGGHLSVMERLMVLAPDDRYNMIKAGHYYAFRHAAQGGHLHVIDRLTALVSPRGRLNMIRAEHYQAFREAAVAGNLLLIERLAALEPTEVHYMIKACNYYSFLGAAEGGYLAIMERLMALAPDEVLKMVKADNCGAFRSAVENGHLPVAKWLLSYSDVLAFAEMNEEKYNGTTHPYIVTKLSALHGQYLAVKAANPDIIFDLVDAEETKCCFFIIRNLIRRNDPGLLEDIRFLLEIPAVKALAHVEVTEDYPNELLGLALRYDNKAAADILLSIPAVKEMAIVQGDYFDEAEVGADLRAPAEGSLPSRMSTMSFGFFSSSLTNMVDGAADAAPAPIPQGFIPFGHI